MKTVLVLGGYGNFGKRIVENLIDITELRILIGGRNLRKAQALVEKLKPRSNAQLEAIALDINIDRFEIKLRTLSLDLLIHTSGPFQGQNHRVPQACIDIGAHYIDLADDRRFVCDISALDNQAKAQDVLVVSGASSVPGLSSTVIDAHQDQFSSIKQIAIAIAPGNKVERGEATIKGILSYTGHPFTTFVRGRWEQRYGWMDPATTDFGDIVGRRYLANVDVPDLELFPKRYAVEDSVRFQAGLELGLLHYAMVAMAYIAKIGMVKNWAPLSKLLMHASTLFLRFGTDIGGMKITIDGLDGAKKPVAACWTLYAPNGVGPFVPTFCAVIVARKLLSGTTTLRGATPCMGLLSLQEFEDYAAQFGIYCTQTGDG